MKIRVFFVKTFKVEGHAYTDAKTVDEIELSAKAVSQKTKLEWGYDKDDTLYEITKPNVYGISYVYGRANGYGDMFYSLTTGLSHKNGRVSDYGKEKNVPEHDYIVVR